MQVRPDAAGMRYAAAQLRARQERLESVMRRLDGQVQSMVFAGPAANRFRTAIAAELDRMRQMAWVLRQAADALTQGAANVEADPTAFYRP